MLRKDLIFKGIKFYCESVSFELTQKCIPVYFSNTEATLGPIRESNRSNIPGCILLQDGSEESGFHPPGFPPGGR